MSFDTAYAEGTGTQDDPYSGSVTLQVEDGMEYWAYVGTYMNLTSSGREISYSGLDGTGLEQSGPVVSGTLIATGTFEIGFTPGGGDGVDEYPYSFTLHIVSDAPDLEFLSNPVSDGEVYYGEHPEDSPPTFDTSSVTLYSNTSSNSATVAVQGLTPSDSVYSSDSSVCSVSISYEDSTITITAVGNGPAQIICNGTPVIDVVVMTYRPPVGPSTTEVAYAL